MNASKFKENTCDTTTCPISQYYGTCVSIGNNSNQCICPSQYEGDLCQYGRRQEKLKNFIHNR